MLSRALLLAAVAAAFAASSASAKTTWLCRPDNAADPCHQSLTSTVLSPTGELGGTEPATRAKRPPIDCFYVYPTVSEEPKPQSDLVKTPAVKAAAQYQAGRFSQVCRVWAPVYHQVTIQGLLQPNTVTQAMSDQGYADVRAAWRDYLAHDNRGRGVVLLGDSQGTFILRELVAKEVEPKASQRRLLVSALLLGGNVTVAKGKDVGGDFKHVPACRKASQTGCVVAYSTFDETPPANSLFGRATEPGREVLCTNPGALGGGSAKLDSYVPTAAFPGPLGVAIHAELGELPKASTPWFHAADAFTARCSADGGAHVLHVTSVPGGRDLTPQPAATWGLHLSDINIAVGTLVDLVRKQAAAYQ